MTDRKCGNSHCDDGFVCTSRGKSNYRIVHVAFDPADPTMDFPIVQVTHRGEGGMLVREDDTAYMCNDCLIFHGTRPGAARHLDAGARREVALITALQLGLAGGIHETLHQ